MGWSHLIILLQHYDRCRTEFQNNFRISVRLCLELDRGEIAPILNVEPSTGGLIGSEREGRFPKSIEAHRSSSRRGSEECDEEYL